MCAHIFTVSSEENESTMSIIENEVTPLMRVEGAVLLEEWIDKEPDVRALANNLNELAGLLFAVMRREQKRPLRSIPKDHN